MAIIVSVTTLGCKRRETAPPKPPEAELWLGGDVNLGDGGTGQLKAIAQIVQGAAGVVNLEGPVARNSPSRKFRLWNAPASLVELAAVNVRVAGIANNHAGDFGPNGPQQTASVLRERGILPAGGNAGPAVLNMSGITIAITAHDLTDGVPEGLASELLGARQQADILIATFHVTGPVSYLPRPELKHAADMAIAAGAKLVVAHGTHAIGPLERRGDTVIAWGLGNVAFACDCTSEEDAILLRVYVQKDKIAGVDVLPLRAGRNKRPAEPSTDANGVFDLLEAVGTSKLTRHGSFASL